MSGVQEIYKSILFLENWQKIIKDITEISVSTLNEYAKNNKYNIHFSLGERYPKVGIKYGNFINYENKDKQYSEFLYFGFNFNLYKKEEILSYPKDDIIGSKLNTLHNTASLTNGVEQFLNAKQDELIDEFIFGMAVNTNGLNEDTIIDLENSFIEDVNHFVYIPIDSHLLFLDKNKEQISTQIINICKKYLFF